MSEEQNQDSIWKYMYEEQKMISEGYRQIIAELQKQIKEKDLQISMLICEREVLRKDFLNKT